jgi:hypothetical protein
MKAFCFPCGRRGGGGLKLIFFVELINFKLNGTHHVLTALIAEAFLASLAVNHHSLSGRLH